MIEKFVRTLAAFKVTQHTGNHYQAVCPGHDDKQSSLSITVTADKILMNCFALCTVDHVLESCGLTYADLFADDRVPTNIYQYRDEAGQLLYEKVKYKDEKGKDFKHRRLSGDKIVYDTKDVQRVPYNYAGVMDGIKAGNPILFVEGEKDAETAKLLGFTATTFGGASDWKDEYKAFFQGATLIQIPDKDGAGLKHANKVTTSLTEVCKSLKVVILPVGKDLTEWVEAGHSDLKPLIDKAQDLVTFKGVPDPEIHKTISGQSFSWPLMNIVVHVNRLTDDAKGILVVKDSDSGRTLHTSDVNLLSTRTLSELATRLNKTRALNWTEMLSIIANRCYDCLQDGGETVNIDAEPKSMEVKYLWYPIIPVGEPVTIFTAGGVGKSILADYCAVNVSNGLKSNHGLPFNAPSKVNVLYLDWEGDDETHKKFISAIKRGIGRMETGFIHYRHQEHPLAQIIDSVRAEVIKQNIGLVIIDSQMAATASGTRGMSDAQIAGEYYNLLRSLSYPGHPVSTLTIDHITKNSMSAEGGAEAPYGSVVKYNRARTVFELRLPEEDLDSEHKEFVLIHRKFNLGRKQKPLGLVCDFTNEGEELVMITYKAFNIGDNPVAAETLPIPIQITNALRRGMMKRAELKECLPNCKHDTFKRTLNRLIKDGKVTLNGADVLSLPSTYKDEDILK